MLLSMIPENPVQPTPAPSQISRREFLAASSAAVLASAIPPAKSTAAEPPVAQAKLALHGGEKAVKLSLKRPARWGEPERERLNAMLDQNSLFYWKGPQTTLFIERFKQVCPMKRSESTRLNSSHSQISYAVFCLKKKKKK